MMMMMMMMKWYPVSRGSDKISLRRRRGELLTLADLGVESLTQEEREFKMREIFSILWKENQQFRSLPACHPSFLPLFMFTIIIANVHHFTVLRKPGSSFEERTEDVSRKSACNSGLTLTFGRNFDQNLATQMVLQGDSHESWDGWRKKIPLPSSAHSFLRLSSTWPVIR